MLNKEHTLLEPFIKEAWRKFTFKEIKKISDNKSDNYVHTVLKRFVSLGTLQEQRIGNSLVYSLVHNVSSLNTLGFVAEYNANATKHIPTLRNN